MAPPSHAWYYGRAGESMPAWKEEMGWIDLAAALSVSAGAAALPTAGTTQADPAFPATQSELIILDREKNDRLTVPVTIGQSGPYQFLVDTGAQATVLSRELADSLGLLDRGSATLIGVASSVVTQTVALDDLGLGSRTTSIARVPLVESGNIGGADGVLGVDALQGQRVLFDFAAGRMEIVAGSDPPRSSGFDIIVRARARLGRLIIADARIDGVRTAVVIDTGAQTSIGNPALARRLRRRDSGTAELFDINGVSAQANIHYINQLQIQSMRLQNVALVFTPSPAFQALDLEDRPAMILGIRELRLFKRVAIDFGRSRVYFDVPSSARDFTGWQGS
jgi:predicted aspartyl protease